MKNPARQQPVRVKAHLPRRRSPRGEGAIRSLAGLILVVLFFIFSATPGRSADSAGDTATFRELVVTTSETDLLLFGVIANAFSTEMVAGLQSGVPIDFSFFLELQRNDPGRDKQILARKQFRHTLTYDTLKDNYRVALEEHDNQVFSFVDLAKAQAAMGEINGATIVELSQLVIHSTYRLRVRADLFKQTLPLSLHHILPFVSWWDRETDWQTIEFNY
ncbi:MAG: DUF4390 domain-containing protein [Desulfopila sp.]